MLGFAPHPNPLPMNLAIQMSYRCQVDLDQVHGERGLFRPRKLRMSVNPYESPRVAFSNGVTLPSRYRVRNSRTTLREFQNLCDSKVVGTIGWLQSKLLFGALDRQIFDVPKPFLQDLCDENDIPEQVRSYVSDISKQAEPLGFRERYFSIGRSTGIQCVGGAVRMLHESGKYFLQAIASTAGRVMLAEANIVSATSLDTSIESFATSNGRPKFRRPGNMHVQYFRNLGLPDLIARHRDWLHNLNRSFVTISTVEQLAIVMDHLTATFCSNLIQRGILEPLP